MAKKLYRVVAEDSIVAGHSTGEEFSHDFSAYEERLLVESGAIEVVKAHTSAKSEREEQ